MDAMRPFISVMPRFTAFVACLLLSAHAWSRYGSDRGQWQILEARYGTAERNIDVTQTLRDLARQDNTIRINNDTFGNDPDPGVVKTLRIYARGPGGATRTFEYLENDVVDGNVFTGWTSGNWGQGGRGGGWGDPSYAQPGDQGEWQILGARYGTAARNIDVTQRLREPGQAGPQLPGHQQAVRQRPGPGRGQDAADLRARPGRCDPHVRVWRGSDRDGHRLHGLEQRDLGPGQLLEQRLGP